MRSLVRSFAILITLSLLTACTSVTTNAPIGLSDGASLDTRLLGGWKAELEKGAPDEIYVFVLPRKKGGLQALVVAWKNDAVTMSPNDAEWWSSEIKTGKAGGHLFMNLRPLLKNGELDGDAAKLHEAGYFPLRYRVDADGRIELFIWRDAAAIKEAIRSGRISGTVDGGDVRIKADARVDAFLAESAPVAFDALFATLIPLASSQTPAP